MATGGPSPVAVPFSQQLDLPIDEEVADMLKAAQASEHWMILVFSATRDGSVSVNRKAVGYPNGIAAIGKTFDVIGQEMAKMAREQGQ
jgi:hypothetical protein